MRRDIKPANLMLDMNGTIWITDFGLARLDGTQSMMVPGDLVSTLRYMSPQQANGEIQEPGQRTDIYSLGVTMYELLCLTPAIQGTT